MKNTEPRNQPSKPSHPAQGSPDPTGATAAGGIVDPHRDGGPHVVPYANDSQANQGTENLQEGSFAEVGRSLEGLKDSPLDEK